MKKTLALILAAAAALSLCGCGMSRGDTAVPSPTGKWTGTEQDITDTTARQLCAEDDAEMQELLSYIDLGEITAAAELTVMPDGSFRLTPVQESLEKAKNTAAERFGSGFDQYLDSALAETVEETGYTQEDYRAALGLAQGEELLDALGIDRAGLLAQLDVPSRLEGLEAALSSEGTYTAEKDALLLSAGERRARYSVSGDTLTLTEAQGESPELWPRSFSR